MESGLENSEHLSDVNVDGANGASLEGEKWRLDWPGFRPLNDRGGRISLSPTADGPIATLARMELNEREGRQDPADALPDLNDPKSP